MLFIYERNEIHTSLEAMFLGIGVIINAQMYAKFFPKASTPLCKPVNAQKDQPSPTQHVVFT